MRLHRPSLRDVSRRSFGQWLRRETRAYFGHRLPRILHRAGKGLLAIAHLVLVLVLPLTPLLLPLYAWVQRRYYRRKARENAGKLDSHYVIER